MEESDYYKSKGSSNDLPIYWYSPECLSSFKFTTKGDVWSYGVTLWEMFTLGDNPNVHLGPHVRQAPTIQVAFSKVRLTIATARKCIKLMSSILQHWVESVLGQEGPLSEAPL